MEMPRPQAMDVDDVTKESDGGAGEDEKGIEAVGSSVQCYECGGFGHLARNCPNRKNGNGVKGLGKKGKRPGDKGGPK